MLPVNYTGSENYTVVQAAKKKLTKKQAKKKLKKWLKKKGIWNPDVYILAYDHKEGNEYVFQYYEQLEDHTATYDWYNVNSKTGKITALFGF